MGYRVRVPTVGDADALGRVHVRAWQAAYRDGLMPDDYRIAILLHDALGTDPGPSPALCMARSE